MSERSATGNIFFHGSPWLLLALALGGAWYLLSRGLGLASPLADGLVTLTCLGLGSYGIWSAAQSIADLLHVTQQFGSGRLEARADESLAGTSGALAAQLNALARTLGQTRDGQAQGELQAMQRLRQEHDRLQELNTELRRALRESRDSARTQSELFSNLSHELRTPLTAVLGYADLLRKSGLQPEQEQHLATLDRSARGMLTMINDLLDWSRIEAGKLRLHEDHFDVLATVEDTTALLAPLAYDKNLELVRIFYHDVPRQLSGDAQRLRQILTNLVSNAIKFTHRGEVVVRVMREREEQGRVWLRFSVSDSGIGISPEQQQALFRPFQQAGRSVGGSGLGLSITRRLAELMGGEVELQSEPNRGSTFSTLLPFTELPQDATAMDTRLRERSVWVLEAHVTARLALAHWLEFWGLRVTAHDSAEALQQALAAARPNTLPSVIIVGARESEAGETHFLERIGAWGQRAPLLVMLASASLDLQARLRAAGAGACLAKSAGHQALQTELLRLTGAGLGDQKLSGRQVLVADNNLPARRYIVALCRELALQPLEAENGAQGLELWRAHRPEFVLLDARMPVLDGPGCARAIRLQEEQEGKPRCRIYAISAHLEPDERRDFLSAGADGILIKPFDGRQLSQLLESSTPRLSPSVSSVLVRDPSLLQLLLEELPEQYGELEQAMSGQDAEIARTAAHQLHGTASFYHLSALKESCAALERQLAQIGTPQHCGAGLSGVRDNLHHTLGDIRERLAAQQT